MTRYRTIDLARMVKIHPNTVRFYEEIGFISTAPRSSSGYRLFDDRHLYQIKICRCIYDCGWLGREIRAASLSIIRAMREWDIPRAIEATQIYRDKINSEYQTARKTAQILQRWANRKTSRLSRNKYSHKQAAILLGVTPEVLRNWERNKLIQIPRTGKNQTRVYSDREIERLRIIYMLRQSKYSISAIYASLNQYDRGITQGMVEALNAPGNPEDRSWVWVGDCWLKALKNNIKGALKVQALLEEIKNISF